MECLFHDVVQIGTDSATPVFSRLSCDISTSSGALIHGSLFIVWAGFGMVLFLLAVNAILWFFK